MADVPDSVRKPADAGVPATRLDPGALTVAPHSRQAERAVLGAAMIDRAAIDACADVLTGEDFYLQPHRAIWTAICDLAFAGRTVDVVTVAEMLTERGELASVGGWPYVNELLDCTPGTAGARAHAEVVRRRALLRQIVGLGLDAAARAREVPEDLQGLVEGVERAVSELRVAGSASRPVTAAEAAAQASAAVHAAADGDQHILGLSTGLRPLDALLGGLCPGWLVVLAARPAQGKTTLACQIAAHVASAGRSAMIVSLEMQARDLALRSLSARSDVTHDRLRRGDLSADEWARFTDATAAYSRLPVEIEQRSGVTTVELAARVRRCAERRRGLALVVVDYVGLVRAPGADNREREVAEVSRSLKELAGELKCPVLACAQLNRAIEGRADKRPQLSDLRDSGCVEQDADVVVMLGESQRKDACDLVDVLVRKHRFGACGETALRFEHEYVRFVEAPACETHQTARGPRRREYGGGPDWAQRAAGEAAERDIA